MVLQFPRTADGNSVDFERLPDDSGIPVSADLDKLIQEVRIAPQAEEWYVDLVAKVSERYGLQVSPVQSELDATPMY